MNFGSSSLAHFSLEALQFITFISYLHKGSCGNPLTMTKVTDPNIELGVDEKPTGVHHERIQLLANLPDPDAGKSDEERAEIVLTLHPRFIPCVN